MFNEFDIACFPSIYESFGVAAVEAQACGTAVIVSDADGLKEATNPGITSLIVKRKSVDDLVEKLELLIDNIDLRKELSLNGRKYVLDNYDMNKNFSLIDNCYKEFMKGKINMQEVKVTLIIPCRNEENYIEECINSALKQTYKNIEILVVDGMSEDKTRDIVKNMSSIHNNIRLINNFKMITPCALNIGIEESSGQAIIIIGAHSYLDEKFVENNVRNLYEKGYDCSGGVIETINENYIGSLISKAMSCPFGVGNALFRYTDKELEVDTVPFGAYKKETLNKIGYFDTELVRNQDDELNLRLINNGGKILLSPDIKSKYYSRGVFEKIMETIFSVWILEV